MTRYTTAGNSRTHEVAPGYQHASRNAGRWEKRQSKREQYLWCLLYLAITAVAVGYQFYGGK